MQEIILIDNTYFSSLVEDIQSAKHSIDLEVYIFKNDSVGKKIANALCIASKRGVKIRILVDGIGTRNWGNEMTLQMEKAGIQTRIFHPILWLSQLNSRNHRKVCIIDSFILYISSANIHEPPFSWRETTVKFIHMETTEFQLAFEKAWNHHFLKEKRRILYKSILNKIYQCQEKAWITNAYFVPDSHLLKALIKASRRHVSVKILLPSKSDVLIASLASKTFYRALLKKGISIYEYLPTMLHAKVLILDNWMSVGSSNLNYRSIKHDLEVDVQIQTNDAKAILEKQFLTDLSHSQKISLADIDKQPLLEYLLGRLILFIRYWL